MTETAALASDAASVPTVLVLRVLSGKQSQVETQLTDGRYLIGNDEADCDLVIDLGLPERQVVVLRVEAGRLSVITLVGDAWVGERHLAAQQSCTLQLGEVLTVGRASMAVAAPGFVFEALQIPGALRKQGDTPEMANVALPPRSRRVLRAATVFRTAVLGACAITGAGMLVWASGGVSAGREPAASAESGEVARLQAQVQTLGYAELRVLSEGDAAQTVVEGYVPDTAAYVRLEQALSRLPRVPALRVYPVRPLTDGLAQRLAEVDAKLALHYAGDGVFETATHSERFSALREVAGRAMKDLSGIKAVRIAFTDVTLPPSGLGAKVTIARSPSRLGELVVTGDKVPLPGGEQEASRFVEIRYGDVPSVVTRQGERLFAGARLADGAVISRIEPNAVILSKGGAERAEALAAPWRAVPWLPPAATSPAPGAALNTANAGASARTP